MCLPAGVERVCVHEFRWQSDVGPSIGVDHLVGRGIAMFPSIAALLSMTSFPPPDSDRDRRVPLIVEVSGESTKKLNKQKGHGPHLHCRI